MSIVADLRGRASSSDSRFQVLDVSILVASMFFWSWFELSVFFSTLFDPFATDASFFEIYRLVVVGTVAATLLFYAMAENLAIHLLDSRRWELSLVFLAIVGNGITMSGASIDSLPVIILGGLFAGIAAPYFLLEWSRMYSRRGASTTAPSIAGALGLSFLLDVLAVSLSPLVRALFTATFPALVVIALYGIQALSGKTKGAEDTDSQPKSKEVDAPAICKGGVLAMDDDLAMKLPTRNSKVSYFGLPITFAVIFFTFGFPFGFGQYSIFDNASDYAIMAPSALAAFIVFAVAYFTPRHFHTCLLVGILIGIAGYLLIPALGIPRYGDLLSEAAIGVGLVCFIVTTWTLLSHISHEAQSSAIASFAPGISIFHMGIFAGYLFFAIYDIANGSIPISTEGLTAIVGYCLLISTTILYVGHYPLWRSLNARLAEGDQSSTETDEGAKPIVVHASAEHLKALIDTYDLTEREGEILGYLLVGRSRPRTAQALCVSENTINSHIQHIYRKMGVSSHQELLDRTLQTGAQH